MTVAVSTVKVVVFEAGFINAVNTNNDSINGVNNDSDSYADRIQWGSGSTQSGYDFVDNEALRNAAQNLSDSTFKLGTFTHNNFPVSGASLKTAELIVKFNVV